MKNQKKKRNKAIYNYAGTSHTEDIEQQLARFMNSFTYVADQIKLVPTDLPKDRNGVDKFFEEQRQVIRHTDFDLAYFNLTGDFSNDAKRVVIIPRLLAEEILSKLIKLGIQEDEKPARFPKKFKK